MVTAQHQDSSLQDPSWPEAPHSPAEAFLQTLITNAPLGQYLEAAQPRPYLRNRVKAAVTTRSGKLQDHEIRFLCPCHSDTQYDAADSLTSDFDSSNVAIFEFEFVLATASNGMKAHHD